MGERHGSTTWYNLLDVFQQRHGFGKISTDTKPVHPKGNQFWIFNGRTDAEAETPILWPPDERNGLIGKDPDARQDWRQEEKGMIEDEMIGWHHQLNGHEFEQAPGVVDGQGSLACCSPWGHRVGHNWATEVKWTDPQKASHQVMKASMLGWRIWTYYANKQAGEGF